jgi:molybdopterin-biosynthesis enzyme MoeA-like protein
MAARMRMALVPQGAQLIGNSTGGPPGFFIGNVYVLAGIPVVMRAMLSTLETRLIGGAVLQSRSVTAYLGESAIADPLAKLQREYPDVEIGSYPFDRDGRYGTTLVLRCSDVGRLAEATEKLKAIIVAVGAEPISE